MAKKRRSNRPGSESQKSNVEVVEALVIKSASVEHSQQLKVSDKSFTRTGALKPPFDPVLWGSMMEYSTRLSRCIHTEVQNTVGYGYRIGFVDGFEITPNTSPEVKAKVASQIATLRTVFDHPNKDMSFNQMMEQEGIDEEATGNGYVEVVRNLIGKIAQLYHAPASIMRVLANGDGFIQTIQGKKRFFKNFGDLRTMDVSTGKFVEEKLPLDQRASEIIHFKTYSPSSPIYGVPGYTSCSPAVSGNRLAAERNVNFFKNNAVPNLAITVTGGKLSSKSVQSIREFMAAEQKGTANAHRTMVLQSEGAGMGPLGNTGAKIEIKEIGVGSKDDASFLEYRAANDEEIRESFGIGQIFFGTKNISKGNATESRRITNDQVFLPATKKKEYRLYHTIVADLLERDHELSHDNAVARFVGMDENEGTPLSLFKRLSPLEQRDALADEMRKQHFEYTETTDGNIRFKEKALVTIYFEHPKIGDPLEEARVDNIYARLATYTINELRQKVGKDEIEVDWANLPYPILLHSERVSEGTEGLPGSGSEGVPTSEGEVEAAVVEHLLDIRKLIIKELANEQDSE